MQKDRVVVAALVGWLVTGWLVAAPQFVPGPSGRTGHCMVLDEARQVTVLFGGFDGANFSDETWEWDGALWTQVTTATSPSARTGAAMAYDASRGVVVLFGGGQFNASLSAEVWEFDGQDWALKTGVGAGPTPRRDAALNYHAASGGVVLFGGWGGPLAGYADTWVWNGVSWSQVSPTNSPGPRYEHSSCRLGPSGDVLVYGGLTHQTRYSDTWKWDGLDWTQVSVSAAPSARLGAALEFVPAMGVAALFGGSTSPGIYADDTWIFDGASWVQVLPAADPASRAYVHGALAVDPAGHGAVIFGGSEPGGAVLGDTWTFDGTEWRPKLDYVTSPVNGRRYALSPPLFWQDAESLAVLEGGHLVTVRSATENAWLYQNLVAGQGIPTAWIGLNDAAVEGQFVWASGEAVTYTSWAPGQPDNASNEDYVHYYGVSGDWNDLCPQGCQQYPGIVELPSVAVASYVPFGAGCPGPTGAVPSLSAPPGEAPIIGGSSVLQVSNLPLSVTIPVFMLGFSNTQASSPGGVYPLPLDLGILGWPGCLQLVDAVDTVYTITNTGSADHTVTLPPFPFLAGMQFYAQVLVLYAPSGVAVSNAITATAGW